MKADPTSGPWDVVFSPFLEPFLSRLRRVERTYLKNIRDALASNPCDPRFYRLSGDLGAFLCGGHMQDDWRVAFTIQKSEDAAFAGQVYVLYIDRRQVLNRDVWVDLFALFGRENPESGHTKPPCCDDVFETIDDETFNHFAEEVADFLKWKHDR